MRISRSILSGSVPMALACLLGGCDTADRAPAAPAAQGPVGAKSLDDSSPYDRDLIAAKHGPGTNAERDASVRAVLNRYGVELAPAPAAPQPGPEPAPMAAAKTASTFTRVVSKFSANNDIHTFFKSVLVPGSGTLVVSAVGNSDGADPFSVGFYRPDPTGSPTGYYVDIIGENDDINGQNRNSRFTWINPSPSNRVVDIVVFNYLPSTRGTVNVDISVNGVVTSYPNRFLGGKNEYPVSDITVPSNCTPAYTRVTGTVTLGGGFSEAALVVDSAAHKGGIFWDGGVGSQSLNFTPLLNLRYPDFGLLFEATSDPYKSSWSEEASGYQYTQKEVYSCP